MCCGLCVSRDLWERYPISDRHPCWFLMSDWLVKEWIPPPSLLQTPNSSHHQWVKHTFSNSPYLFAHLQGLSVWSSWHWNCGVESRLFIGPTHSFRRKKMSSSPSPSLSKQHVETLRGVSAMKQTDANVAIVSSSSQNQNYKGFVSGVFSGIAKLSGSFVAHIPGLFWFFLEL